MQCFDTLSTDLDQLVQNPQAHLQYVVADGTTVLRVGYDNGYIVNVLDGRAPLLTSNDKLEVEEQLRLSLPTFLQGRYRSAIARVGELAKPLCV